MVLNNAFIANGEFTIFEEPVVTTNPSNIPAELDDRNIANKKKIIV
tara:strand:- start:473 stop:610 length:138 start_codon:yes stop_codon:yes gene_type:complete